MLEISLDDFRHLNGIQQSGPPVGRDVSAISIDSRSIQKNEVFWALKGEKFDGHDFLNKVADKAAFAVVDREHESKAAALALFIVPDTLSALQELAANHRQKYDIPVIAVTGSNGKTTVKEMLAGILEQKWQTHKTKGNFNNHIGCPLTILGLKKIHRAAVVELGTNHPGEIKLLAGITKPNHAIITNIGSAHLEFFKNEKALAVEKQSLFEGLQKTEYTYLNIDDPFLLEYESKKAQTITYSLHKKADVQGKIIGVNETGSPAWRLNDMVNINMRAPGLHNAANGLAAAAVALNLGFSASEIKDALENFTAFDKRLQVQKVKGFTVINDAYNANPVSMRALFDTVALIEHQGQVYFALGDMFELGEQSLKLHQQVLREALQKTPAALFLIGENMRQAYKNLSSADQAEMNVFSDHKEMAGAIKNMIKPGDMLLIKGSRGVAMEKIVEYL